MRLFTNALKRKHVMPIMLSLFAAAALAGSPQRLDMYDNADNHLMFVTFDYENQKNISRTVYMSDSTFVRKVFITYDLQGKRVRESSLNFNSDTSFATDYQYRGDTAMFSIKDIFGIDQMGGRVRYLTNDSLSYSFSYQTSGPSVTYVISYEKNSDGDLAKVTVSDYVLGKLYYGVFNYGGTVTKMIRHLAEKGPIASVRMLNPRVIDIGLDLKKPSIVKCCLVSLSGRSAGTLFEERLSEGAQVKRLRVGQNGLSRLAQGVYMLTVSIDGAIATKTKFLYQHSSLGGAQ